MHCDGEKLSIDSGEEWLQMMGERLRITAKNSSNTTSSTTTTTNTNNSSSTSSNTNKANMVRADSITSNAARVVDKPSAQDHPQAPLRCPRCDSSNTKFCYYNNYSLSQPRHFCKACKRYWTRGGTLRNVPVGGGCRKNKRAKKPGAAPTVPPNSKHPRPLLPPDPVPSLAAQISTSSHLDATAIYALQTAASPSDMSLNLPIISNGFHIPSSTSAFDLQPHLGALGLGLSSNMHRDDEYQFGELRPLLPVNPAMISLLNDYPLFGSSLSSASLLVSGIKQPKQVEDYQTLLPFDELQASGMGDSINGMMKEVKLEGQTNTMTNNNMSSCIDWQIPSENSLDNLGPAAAMYWNAAIGGGGGGGGAGWPDGTNYGSSVAPLIYKSSGLQTTLHVHRDGATRADYRRECGSERSCRLQTSQAPCVFSVIAASRRPFAPRGTSDPFG
ncbi:unnamed protein product [Musa acuminata subsp. burmannicoides]